MKRNIILLSLVSLLFIGLSANNIITVKGSDTMVILAQRWAEVYMKKNKNVVIQVTGGGSGTGISALINGTTDICNSSRPIKKEEKIKLKEKYGTTGVEIKVAIDGLSIYVNQKNPVNELTLDQVKDIYTGKINNWKEVGGKDAQIIRYSRENNSGTYVYFKDEVLKGEDFDRRTQYLPGTAAVVNAVAKDINGIGYGGAAYGVGIKELKIKKDAKSPAYAPTVENIKKGLYPISRFLYMYLRKKPEGEIKKFIDWILSEEGQKVVKEVGYFPIR
jgi:phosphate transport system substrate-binding protein